MGLVHGQTNLFIKFGVPSIGAGVNGNNTAILEPKYSV